MLELSRKIDRRAIVVRELIITGALGSEQDQQLRDRENCFAEIYEAEAEALCAAMLRAGREEATWRDGVRAALTTLLEFAAARPKIANALFREVHIVGGPALAKREEVIERLTAAVERGREELIGEAAVGPQPSRFVAGAVEGVIAGHLSRGQAERLPGLGPELTRFVIGAVLGIEAATGEIPADA